MPHLTPEQKEQITKDLTALGWVRPPSSLETRSAQVISERIGCSTEDANLILQRLQAENIIESVSESGGNPAVNRTLDSYGWKWVRK